MTDYGRRQGRVIDLGAVAAAMVWSDPERDVAVPRRIALHLASRDQTLHSAWTGRVLTVDTLDIDHLFPWSAWLCGDLWNLLPAHRMVNQRLKRSRLPSAQTLAQAGERILDWWRTAYVTSADPLLPGRFGHEARASLPGIPSEGREVCDPERVLTAVSLQRMRLHHDQQVPEWVI